jgi:hypothetical protein
MRTEDTSASLDRYDDGDEAELHVSDDAVAEAVDRVDDPDAEPDDELLEAELGAHDIAIDDNPALDDLDDAPDDDDCDDDDADRELCLLQELGIDLDAPDGPVDDLDITLHDHEGDAPLDDEVAA